MENNEKNNNEEQNDTSDVKSCREEYQEVEITLEEINAEKHAGSDGEATDEEVKAAIDEINPDESSMNSRG